MTVAGLGIGRGPAAPTSMPQQRPRARSLGTTAMARAGKFDDSDSSDDLGMNVPMPLAHRELRYPDAHPVFPPPPTATARIKRKKVSSPGPGGVRPKPEPLSSLPPVPPVPSLAATASAIPDTPKQLESAAVTPSVGRSRRKTLLERIEGWWDLGLLDKRQTLFRSQSKTMAEQKL